MQESSAIWGQILFPCSPYGVADDWFLYTLSSSTVTEGGSWRHLLDCGFGIPHSYLETRSLTFLVYGRRYFHFKVVLQAGGVSGCGAVGSNSSHPEMVRLQRPGLLHFLKQVHHLEQRLKLSPPFVLQHWIKSYLWSFGWSRKKNLIAFPGKGGPQWANAL